MESAAQVECLCGAFVCIWDGGNGGRGSGTFTLKVLLQSFGLDRKAAELP